MVNNKKFTLFGYLELLFIHKNMNVMIIQLRYDNKMLVWLKVKGN